MITFSGASVTEFKQRLYDLIGRSAFQVEIKTFHSYCFDLLGRMEKLEGAEQVAARAAAMIKSGSVEAGRITKTVAVIDEARDMDKDAAALIHALMEQNEEMRVIAVGDDDWNIYGFRGLIPDTCGNLPVRTGLCVTSCWKTTAAAAPLWRMPCG